MNLKQALTRIVRETLKARSATNESWGSPDVIDIYGATSLAYKADFCTTCGADKARGQCDCINTEEDSLCEICGGNKGVCECTMTEEDGDECPECGGPPGKHDPRCPLKNESKSSLRLAVHRIMKEMKLGVAGRGSFDFGAKDDEEDVATFLLNKKEKDEEAKEKAPPPEKSGTKLKTTKKRSKSSQFR